MLSVNCEVSLLTIIKNKKISLIILVRGMDFEQTKYLEDNIILIKFLF